MRGATEKQRRFASAYVRLANATKAALEAGYTAVSAASTGSVLLRHPNVIALIESSRVRRDVHADQTYQQLIALANASMKLANETLNREDADLKEKFFSLEGAGRAVERVARCEGLMVEIPTRPDEGRLTLQNLAQKLRKGIELVQPRAGVVEVREVDVKPDAPASTVTPVPETGTLPTSPESTPVDRNGGSNGH